VPNGSQRPVLDRLEQTCLQVLSQEFFKTGLVETRIARLEPQDLVQVVVGSKHLPAHFGKTQCGWEPDVSQPKDRNSQRTASYFAQKNRFVVGALRQEQHFANRGSGRGHSYSFSCFGKCADRKVQAASTS
jgi:hypothetical protein